MPSTAPRQVVSGRCDKDWGPIPSNTKPSQPRDPWLPSSSHHNPPRSNLSTEGTAVRTPALPCTEHHLCAAPIAALRAPF